MSTFPFALFVCAQAVSTRRRKRKRDKHIFVRDVRLVCVRERAKLSFLRDETKTTYENPCFSTNGIRVFFISKIHSRDCLHQQTGNDASTRQNNTVRSRIAMRWNTCRISRKISLEYKLLTVLCWLLIVACFCERCSCIQHSISHELVNRTNAAAVNAAGRAVAAAATAAVIPTTIESRIMLF